MEDPANEVEGVVRALVDKPTLLRQAKTLKKYFTNDVEFYHFYINTSCGLRALTAIYQIAQLFLNYRYCCRSSSENGPQANYQPSCRTLAVNYH